MAKLIYSAIASLDGYVEDEAGKFDWAAPDDEVHAYLEPSRARSARWRGPSRPRPKSPSGCSTTLEHARCSRVEGRDPVARRR